MVDPIEHNAIDIALNRCEICPVTPILKIPYIKSWSLVAKYTTPDSVNK